MAEIITTGFKELIDELANIDEKRVKPALRKSLRAGAKVVLEAAKDAVPEDTGALRASLNVRAAKKKKRSEVAYIVGAERGSLSGFRTRAATAEAKAAAKAGRKAATKGTQFYAAFVELGTVHQAAQPYLRPALDENKQEVLDEIGSSIKASLEAIKI